MIVVICMFLNGVNVFIWNSVVKKSVNIFNGFIICKYKIFFWNKILFCSFLMYNIFFLIIEFLNEKNVI